MITFGAISVIQVMAPFLWRNSRENEDTVSHLWPGEEKNDKPRRLHQQKQKGEAKIAVRQADKKRLVFLLGFVGKQNINKKHQICDFGYKHHGFL